MLTEWYSWHIARLHVMTCSAAFVVYKTIITITYNLYIYTHTCISVYLSIHIYIHTYPSTVVGLCMCICHNMRKCSPSFSLALTFAVCLFILHAIWKNFRKIKNNDVTLLLHTLQELFSTSNPTLATLPIKSLRDRILSYLPHPI